MTMAALNRAKIPTDSPQLRRGAAGRSVPRTTVPAESPQPSRGRPGRARKGSPPARPKVIATGTGRDSTRGGDEVIELECGITVYPARSEGGRWRAVWYEAGARQQCEAATEAKLAPKLEKIAERLQADAPNMRRPGADLIAHYLDPDRLPVHDRWSRKHAGTQRRLCERFAAPVIAVVTCQDIKPEHTQKIVNAAPTAGEGDRVHRMLSALFSAGIDAGYLTSPRLARVHWQAGDRPMPAPAVSVAGESSLVRSATLRSAAAVAFHCLSSFACACARSAPRRYGRLSAGVACRAGPLRADHPAALPALRALRDLPGVPVTVITMLGSADRVPAGQHQVPGVKVLRPRADRGQDLRNPPGLLGRQRRHRQQYPQCRAR